MIVASPSLAHVWRWRGERGEGVERNERDERGGERGGERGASASVARLGLPLHWAQLAPHSHTRTQSSTRAATAHATIRWPPGVASSRAAARCDTRRMAQVRRKPAAPATVCDRGCNPMSSGLQPYVGAG